MCLCVFVFEEVTGWWWGGTIPHSASPPRAPQFTWAMACFQLWLGFQHSNMGTPGYNSPLTLYWTTETIIVMLQNSAVLCGILGPG